MRKNLAAIVTSVLVLGCAFPVFAAPKNVYTDADSGFAVQTDNPSMEYASRYSYGFLSCRSCIFCLKLRRTLNRLIWMQFNEEEGGIVVLLRLTMKKKCAKLAI